MFDIGVQELMVVLAIVALLFGPSRLPQIGDGVGKMISGFRKSMREGADDPEPEPAAKLPAPEVAAEAALAEGAPDLPVA